MKRVAPWWVVCCLLLCCYQCWVACPAPFVGEPLVEVPPDVGFVDDMVRESEVVVIQATPGTKASFALDGRRRKRGSFFSFPFPSDLRLKASGVPDLSGFPNPDENALVSNLVEGMPLWRGGFSVSAVAYFHFDGALSKRATLDGGVVWPAAVKSPLMLLDVDPKSPTRGTLYPLVAKVLEAGVYVPKNLLAVGVAPGVILPANRLYAFVVMRSFGDQKDEPLGVPLALNQLKVGQVPDGAYGAKLAALYAPLWEVLREAKIKIDDVAAATVFRTGDVVSFVAGLFEKVRKAHTPKIDNLALDPDDGDHSTYCELHGTITLPQFQEGTPPYDTKGQFVFAEQDPSALPKVQRMLSVPVALSIPKKEMPKGGYPLLLYIHGSGGLSTQVMDRGKREGPNQEKRKGGGPAFVVASSGMAAIGSAMPVNPQRLKGATSRAYLNLNNLAAYASTYIQGVLEQGLLLDAVSRLVVPPAVLGACQVPTLPAGEAGYRFSLARLPVLGQSMGASYATMLGAVDQRVKAVLPTGAGGLWSYFIPNSGNPLLKPELLQRVLASTEELHHLHPLLQVLQASWDGADPAVFAPRVSRRPLPGHQVRQIYQPIGRKDGFHPEPVMDVVSLAFGHQQVGETIWPGTQARLVSGGFGGVATYPVSDNRKSEVTQSPYTSVVVQFAEDPITQDGHYVAYQLDPVIYQWRCFIESFVQTGKAIVVDPKKIGQPCVP